MIIKIFSNLNKKNKINNKAFSLVEIAIAMGLMVILIPALTTGFVASREGKPQRENRVKATALLKEAEEALRSVREKGWVNVQTGGLYYPTVSGSTWTLTSGTEIIDTYYTRQILIEDIQRDVTGNIVTSGGVLDPSTKKATITIAWDIPRNDYLQTIVYLTRFNQNNTITQTSEADFLTGTTNSTEVTNSGGGAVSLLPPSVTMAYTDDYITAPNYNYDPAKIEFVGGFAQLKGTSTAGGSTTNPGFDTNTTGWTLAIYGTPPPNPTLSRIKTGGNPGAFARIIYSAARNRIVHGYIRQAFTLTNANSPAYFSFDKKVSAYDTTPGPLDFRIRVYIDTNTGMPTNLVWDSGTIVSTSPTWSSTINLDVSPFVTNPGTYHLKVGGFVKYPSANNGPFNIDLDNVILSWSGPTTYPTDSPTVTWNNSYAPTGLTAWSGFSSVENTNGGSIRYQLSNDNGTTWYYHNGSIWTTASSSQYNTASQINDAISTFPLGNNSIRVKAFLISNGSQLVRLDSVTLQYTSGSGSSSGTFTSSTIDAGAEAAFNRITWSDTNTANTTTQFQIATNNDNSTWTFVGPDGTASTYFTNEEGIVNLQNILGRYFRYKIYFNTTNSDLPSVSEVIVNYSP